MHYYLLPLLAAGLLTTAQLQSRPNDKDFTPASALAAHCDTTCQEALQQNIELDRSDIYGNVAYPASFYETAPNFASSQPGDLLKLQRLNESTLNVPPGTSIYLIQYTSVGLNSTKVPATGFIALPYTPPGPGTGNNTQYPLIAYAHGTIGYEPSCAPSGSYNLYNYWTWPLFTLQGYAVVATDYAGLGNNYTSHKYVNPVLNAEDVYFSVVAARKAFPNLFTTRWAAAGHSQGGGAVWALTENPRVVNGSALSGDFVGSLAFAPGVWLQETSAGLRGDAAKLAPALQYAFEAVNAPIQPKLLTPDAQSRARLVKDLQLCYWPLLGLNDDLPHYGVTSDPDALKESIRALQWWDRTYGAAMGKRAYGKVLVLQGMEDELINFRGVVKALRGACEAQNSVWLMLYPGLNHDSIVAASQPEWMYWLEVQMRGEGVGTTENSSRCKVLTRAPRNQVA